MGTIGNENETKNIRKRKKLLKRILLIILAAVLIAIAVIAFRYRSHIKSAYIWATSTGEDIQKNIDKAKDEQTQVLNESGFNASKELDEALLSGRITAEQHTSVLLGEVTLDELLADGNVNEAVPDSGVSQPQTDTSAQQSETGQPDTIKQNPEIPSQSEDSEDDVPGGEKGKEKPPQTQSDSQEKTKPSGQTEEKTPVKIPEKIPEEPDESETSKQSSASNDVDKRTAELVTRMYVLKSEYTGAVEGVVASMKAEYSKLPAEQRNFSAKQSIATSYLGKINAMEAQCDAQVNAIVTELRQLLKANGRDTSLADTIQAAYATEKENTKAYYLSVYGD